jgi:DNA polymerase I-like protein with 3'-5' exonuclease and polymerase domains
MLHGPGVIEEISRFLGSRPIWGWNVVHDQEWLDTCFGIKTQWQLDARIAWYLLDREQSEVGYSLKRAQVKILGWPEANDGHLRLQVASRGGSVDKGQHYLADLDVLGKYAALDAKSTLQAGQKLVELFDSGDWASHNRNLEYAQFLAKSTRVGVEVDLGQLEQARAFYQEAVDKASADIRLVCAPEITEIERRLGERWKTGYKTTEGLDKAIAKGRAPRFNPNSSAQRSVLFHDIIGIPVFERSKKTGAPKSDKKTIAKFEHPSAKAFVALSENEKALQFAEQYSKHAKNSRVHFPLDTVSTVSERLGGYAPYCLNMPFTREPIMQAFRVPDGLIGTHMDLVSVEPCLIAGFSGDPAMLKVYRDGLGDIYLDLCLDMFPAHEAGEYKPELALLIEQLHSEYNTNAPPISAQKEKFDKLRKPAKIVHLAAQYTGTKYTISKNLTYAGFPTSVDKGEEVLFRYWNRLSRVASLANKLKSLAEDRGYITGLFGRKLYVPKRLSKDALNRFGQHGGHAILREIVLEINKTKISGMRPLLPDLHDATSWSGPEQHAAGTRAIFAAAIRRVNDILCLPVTVAGEIKHFRTFYGLKNREEL